MDKRELKHRLKQLAMDTGRLCLILPLNIVNRVYVDQLVRCSSSSAANYRSACRGKSKADFINKLRTVEEELDETMFFYEMIADFNESAKVKLRILYKEANELLSIFVASLNTATSNLLKEEAKRKNNQKRKSGKNSRIIRHPKTKSEI
jgi:four helix bundle protein